MLRFPRVILPMRALGHMIRPKSVLLRPQCRTYAKRGKALANPSALARRQRQGPAEREVWVDPFKEPPPPQPNYRVLIKPAIFTALVLLLADPVAQYVQSNRTTKANTRAERDRATSITLGSIIAANIGVFLGWRAFPSLLHRIGAILVPYNPTPAQLVVSSFSQQEVWHLAFNQIAMWMFGSVVCNAIGPEHFLAFYLKAACVSSLASVTAAQVFVKRGFWGMDHLMRGSLGASGVAYALLGFSAIVYPEMQVGLIFIPFVFFPLKYVFPSVLAFDTLGLALRWTQFDHVAHVCSLPYVSLTGV
jgi:membrane associated rhomboid family serine protease